MADMTSFSDPYTVDSGVYLPHSACGFEPNPETGKRGAPYIEIAISYRRFGEKLRQWLFHPRKIVARVDTGADKTILGQGVPKGLEIAPGTHSARDVQAVRQADGSVCVGVCCKLDLLVGSTRLLDVPVLLSLRVDTAYAEYLRLYPKRQDQQASPFSGRPLRANLLGTRGVLDQVLMCLDSGCLYLFKRRAVGDLEQTIRTNAKGQAEAHGNSGGLATRELPGDSGGDCGGRSS